MASFNITPAMNREGYSVKVIERGFGVIKGYGENIEQVCEMIKHYFGNKHDEANCPFCKE